MPCCLIRLAIECLAPVGTSTTSSALDVCLPTDEIGETVFVLFLLFLLVLKIVEDSPGQTDRGYLRRYLQYWKASDNGINFPLPQTHGDTAQLGILSSSHDPNGSIKHLQVAHLQCCLNSYYA